MKHVVQLTMPARPEFLILARLALTGIARTTPALDDVTLADLKLAVTEACGNAARHAYDGEAGPVHIQYTLEEGHIEIVVADEGTGRDLPADAPTDHLLMLKDGLVESGMGLSIIRAIVDETEIESRTNGQQGAVVTMRKRLATPGPEDSPRGDSQSSLPERMPPE